MEWCLIRKRCALGRGGIPDQIDRAAVVLAIVMLIVHDHMTGDTMIGDETIGIDPVIATRSEIEDEIVTATETEVGTEIEGEIDIMMTATMTDVGDDKLFSWAMYTTMHMQCFPEVSIHVFFCMCPFVKPRSVHRQAGWFLIYDGVTTKLCEGNSSMESRTYGVLSS